MVWTYVQIFYLPYEECNIFIFWWNRINFSWMFQWWKKFKFFVESLVRFIAFTQSCYTRIAVYFWYTRVVALKGSWIVASRLGAGAWQAGPLLPVLRSLSACGLLLPVLRSLWIGGPLLPVLRSLSEGAIVSLLAAYSTLGKLKSLPNDHIEHAWLGTTCAQNRNSILTFSIFSKALFVTKYRKVVEYILCVKF